MIIWVIKIFFVVCIDLSKARVILGLFEKDSEMLKETKDKEMVT